MVGVPRPTGRWATTRDGGRGRGRGAVRAAGRQGRGGPRDVRRVRAAGRRRPDGLVARRVRGRAAGGVRAASAAPRSGRSWRRCGRELALHRPAEFNKSHVPAFLADERPRGYVCVYPFVRSYEWYLLPDEERREMLAEHGKMARGYPDVRANTVASFALGDYEWMLAFEADELHRIVDLMRHLRASTARRHVREEVPFYTGRRRPVADLVAALPSVARRPARRPGRASFPRCAGAPRQPPAPSRAAGGRGRGGPRARGLWQPPDAAPAPAGAAGPSAAPAPSPPRAGRLPAARTAGSVRRPTRRGARSTAPAPPVDSAAAWTPRRPDRRRRHRQRRQLHLGRRGRRGRGRRRDHLRLRPGTGDDPDGGHRQGDATRTGRDVVLDGGGRVTLERRRAAPDPVPEHLRRGPGLHHLALPGPGPPRLVVQNLTFADGNSTGETDRGRRRAARSSCAAAGSSR